VARTEGRRGAYRVLVGRLREREHLEDLDVDGDNIKNGTSRSGMRRHGLDCRG